MKHVFIINPRAGKRDGTGRMLAMAEALREKHGLDCSCLLTQSPGNATELAGRLAQSGEELRIYACGGDGTAGEVAGGIAGFANAAMTCVPIGTGNDLLKNFGEDAAKFFDAENLWDGDVFPLDLIDCNGRLALTIACSGIDARIAEDVHRYSANPLLSGKGSYIASLLVNFLFKGIGKHWTVSLDGEKIEGEFAVVSVCNGRYYGGGFMPIAEAGMCDGVLDTMMVKSVGRLKFAQFVGAYAKGDYRKFPQYAKVSQAKEIRISSPEEDIVTCLDGETLRGREMLLRLSERRVNFFAPAGASPDRTRRDDGTLCQDQKRRAF